MLVVASLLAGACFQPQEPPRQFVPGDPLYEQFSSQGDRIIVDADDEQLALKVRRRRHTTRVFDHAMRPVGTVSIDEDEVEHRTVDGQNRTTARWLDDDSAQLDGAWRIERADGGWDIFDDHATVIALLRRSSDDEQWILRPTRGALVTLSIDTDGDITRIVTTDDRRILEAAHGELSPISLLILTLDELPALDRYSLAAWADLHL